jgi:hypothetical protein
MKGTPFNFYVHRAGKTDRTACPLGCDSIMVLVPCPALTRKEGLASIPRNEAIDAYKRQFDGDVVDDVRDAVFLRLAVLDGLKNLKDLILDEVVDTPGTYAEYYNVGAGVPFGLVSRWTLQSCTFFRCLIRFFVSPTPTFRAESRHWPVEPGEERARMQNSQECAICWS